MLYHLLAERLQEYFSPFRMFQAITFRAIYAAVLAFLTSLLLGPWMIRKLQELRFGQQVRREGLESHLAKEGTPTMGGLLIVAAWIVNTLLWARLDNPLVWSAVFATLWFGIIGFLDDWTKIKQKRSLGLTVRQKIAEDRSSLYLSYVTELGLMANASDFSPLFFLMWSKLNKMSRAKNMHDLVGFDHSAVDALVPV